MLAGSSFHPNPCLSRHPWAPRQTLHRSCHNSPRPSTCHRGTEKVHNWRDDPDQHSPLRKKEWLTGWLYFQVYPKATVSIFLKIQKKLGTLGKWFGAGPDTLHLKILNLGMIFSFLVVQRQTNILWYLSQSPSKAININQDLLFLRN